MGIEYVAAVPCDIYEGASALLGFGGGYEEGVPPALVDVLRYVNHQLSSTPGYERIGLFRRRPSAALEAVRAQWSPWRELIRPLRRPGCGWDADPGLSRRVHEALVSPAGRPARDALRVAARSGLAGFAIMGERLRQLEQPRMVNQVRGSAPIEARIVRGQLPQARPVSLPGTPARGLPSPRPVIDVVEVRR